MDKFQWFRDAKFGMMVHWGLYALAAGEWRGRRMDYTVQVVNGYRTVGGRHGDLDCQG